MSANLWRATMNLLITATDILAKQADCEQAQLRKT
jgi:hypothetical protein